MSIPTHVCCQCECPVTRNGDKMIGPAHFRQRDYAGRGESEEEYQARRNAFRATIPIGTSTRCSVHNAKWAREYDRRRRKGKGKRNK